MQLRNKMRLLTVVLCSFIFLVSCFDTIQESDSVLDDTPFTRLLANHTGIDFSNTLQEDLTNKFNIVAWEYFYNGSGVAIGDLNNDGLSDLVFASNMDSDRIYLNKGNMEFEDISEQSNLNQYNGWSTGVTIVDINNDGYSDIYICRAGPDPSYEARRNLLFINNGDATFTEQAKAYGLDDDRLSTQAAFLDYNKDGKLDCFIINESIYVAYDIAKASEEVKNDKAKMRHASNALYANVGNKYVDITEKAGLLGMSFGLGIGISDFNDDFWPDIYVSNDYQVSDKMYINQQDGTFKEEIRNKMNHVSWYSMGIDIADINNDGFLDVGTVEMASADHYTSKVNMKPMNTVLFDYTMNVLGNQRQHMFNSLQINNGDGTYSNVASLYDVDKTEWSWAALFVDLDNDGDKDYYVTNGYRKCTGYRDFGIEKKSSLEFYDGNIPLDKRQELYDKIPTYESHNIAYRNNGFGQFNNEASAWGLDDLSYSSGAAYADLDNDGDLDLVVNNVDSEAFIYRNNSKNNYFRVALKSDKLTLGTRVKIYTGEVQQIVEYQPVRGYLSKMEDFIHFGLGNEDKIDSMHVIWPNQKVSRYTNLEANQVFTATYDAATVEQYYPEKPVGEYLAKSVSKIDYRHRENFFDDFEKEVLLPYKQSTLGPFISKGDVNGDKLDDFYIGGALNQPGKLYIQAIDGSFVESSKSVFENHAACEDMGSMFFDYDGDGDQDLYVCSGGSEVDRGDPRLLDRLYINDGSGNYKYAPEALPALTRSSSTVSHSDFDNDGDMDIFIGARIKPQLYPYPEYSTILRNDEGVYKDIGATLDTKIVNAGIINASTFTDIDGDGNEDLVIAGEWTGISVFTNNDGVFLPVSAVDKDYKGWWFSLLSLDFDNDGDEDLIAGNLGLNTKFKASFKKPLKVYGGDFDQSGTYDVVLAKEYKGKEVPVRGRQCSSEQMPFISEKFETYEAFATAGLSDILGQENLNKAIKRETNTFESMLFVNDGNGNFTGQPLPKEAQAFPVRGSSAIDLDGNGYKDLILTGNLYDMEIETASLNSGRGLVLLNDGKTFTAVPGMKSGMSINKDMRNNVVLQTSSKPKIVVANNNSTLDLFDMK